MIQDRVLQDIFQMFVTRLDSSPLGVEVVGTGLSVGRGARIAEAGTQTDPPSEATVDAASEACGWPSGDVSLDGSRCGAADYARAEWVEPWHDRYDCALGLGSSFFAADIISSGMKTGCSILSCA